jgi:hypothetical protein
MLSIKVMRLMSEKCVEIKQLERWQNKGSLSVWKYFLFCIQLIIYSADGFLRPATHYQVDLTSGPVQANLSGLKGYLRALKCCNYIYTKTIRL